MSKKTFKMTLRVRDCTKEIKEGMGEGVLITQELVYNLKDDKEYDGYMFARELHDQQERFLTENMSVEIEETE